ncbi:FRG domain-containing protein [Pseudomonas putida]|uniref:FRG domain-containing protein n=1 Tax=Pseudomonas putida TaxID=303 RepID=UPI00383B1870
MTELTEHEVDLQLLTARTFVEFVNIIDSLKPDEPNSLWFRGQSDASYQLTPGALRDTKQSHDYLGRKIKDCRPRISSGGLHSGPHTETMLAEFKNFARPFLEQQPTNEFEWMFVAQHHRLPTRLLDWSTNALVALFFAAQNAKVRKGSGLKSCQAFKRDHLCDKGFSIFAIEPAEINRITCGTSRPIDVAASPEDWDDYICPVAKSPSTLPICVTAPHMTTRIRAQSGTFTLHGTLMDPLDFYDPLKKFITKIFIPYTSTQSILTSLWKVGINESFIYPSLDSIANDIAKSAKIEHEKFLKKLKELSTI